MFGYVTPCRMELKVKDFEKFKAYYCGLCRTIKTEHGNVPRLALNYDMTFLAILIDSLKADKIKYKKITCALHPLKQKLVVFDNEALKYAAQCNIVLTYYKLIDNINDDKAVKSRIASLLLKKYVKDNDLNKYIYNSLNSLYIMENEAYKYSIDEISHAFADLTGHIISYYIDDSEQYKENLYWLGYNLGKWIYIIDAWDDLKKDMEDNKFNVIAKLYNNEGLAYEEFKSEAEERIDFILTSCASACYDLLQNLPLKKNEELLNNILQLGLMEKMDTVFKRSELVNGESL